MALIHKLFPTMQGAGDLVERAVKPVARVLQAAKMLDCLDDKGELKPQSGCGKKRARLNKAIPFKH